MNTVPHGSSPETPTLPPYMNPIIENAELEA
jgi:hypothetical protein